MVTPRGSSYTGSPPHSYSISKKKNRDGLLFELGFWALVRLGQFSIGKLNMNYLDHVKSSQAKKIYKT